MDIRNRHLTPMNSKEWIQFISDNSFTKEELSWIYCCGLIYRELLTDHENLPAVTKTMLNSGMDPNLLITDELPEEKPRDSYYVPLISVLHCQDDQAAMETMELLLENGADPNTIRDFDTFENVFDFYVEEEFIHAPDLPSVSFYGLLLCAAYGGRQQSGHMPFKMLIDEPISIFKDYSRYWYEYVREGEYHSTMYIIEKETGRRVAKYH